MKEGQNMQIPLYQILKAKYKDQMLLNKSPSANFKSQKYTKATRSYQHFTYAKKIENQQEIIHKRSRKSMELGIGINHQQFCSICYSEVKSAQAQSISHCKHKFCKKCLIEYIKTCIESFQLIKCPSQECGQIICSDSLLLRHLKSQKKQKYAQIQIFFKILKDKSNRLCPTQNCKGTLNIQLNPSKCEMCKGQFCSICLLKFHEGNCDQNGANCLQQNYRYQRCAKCKMFVQKNRGCHHITCKCGHQFCYVCGTQWFPKHHCPQMAQFFLQIQLLDQPEVQQINQLSEVQQPFCQRFCKQLKYILFFICAIICFLVCQPFDLIYFLLNILFKAIKYALERYHWYQILLGNVPLLFFCAIKIIYNEACDEQFPSLFQYYHPIFIQLRKCIVLCFSGFLFQSEDISERQ